MSRAGPNLVCVRAWLVKQQGAIWRGESAEVREMSVAAQLDVESRRGNVGEIASRDFRAALGTSRRRRGWHLGTDGSEPRSSKPT